MFKKVLLNFFMLVSVICMVGCDANVNVSEKTKNNVNESSNKNTIENDDKTKGYAHLLVVAYQDLTPGGSFSDPEAEEKKKILFDDDVEVDENTNVINILDKTGLKYELGSYAELFKNFYSSVPTMEPDGEGEVVTKIDIYDTYGKFGDKRNKGNWCWYSKEYKPSKYFFRMGGDDSVKIVDGDDITWEYISLK